MVSFTTGEPPVGKHAVPLKIEFSFLFESLFLAAFLVFGRKKLKLLFYKYKTLLSYLLQVCTSSGGDFLSFRRIYTVRERHEF